MLRGVNLDPGRAFGVGTTGNLVHQYLLRKQLLARRDNRRRKHERPDDKEAIQPNTDKEAQEGSEEPRISGARLEEMVKLASEQDTG